MDDRVPGGTSVVQIYPGDGAAHLYGFSQPTGIIRTRPEMRNLPVGNYGLGVVEQHLEPVAHPLPLRVASDSAVRIFGHGLDLRHGGEKLRLSILGDELVVDRERLLPLFLRIEGCGRLSAEQRVWIDDERNHIAAR